MKRYLWILLAVMALVAGCHKAPLPPDPEDPDNPEVPVIPEPPYTVEESSFSTQRDGLRIGGVLFSPVELKGRKPAVILCHGLDGSWLDTEPYGRAAARLGCVSFCFDFCGGHDGESKSEGERKDHSVLTEIQDVAAVYNAMKAREDVDPNRIFLMGGSQGGLVAALYAADHPSYIKAMGLMFPAFNLPELVRTYTNLFYQDNLENVPASVDLLGHTFYKKYITDAYGLYPFDTIGAYEGPVLIMHGDKDSLVPIDNSRTALQKYKNATLVVFEGQGHGFDDEGTAKAIENLEEFLSQHWN